MIVVSTHIEMTNIVYIDQELTVTATPVIIYTYIVMGMITTKTTTTITVLPATMRGHINIIHKDGKYAKNRNSNVTD